VIGNQEFSTESKFVSNGILISCHYYVSNKGNNFALIFLSYLVFEAVLIWYTCPDRCHMNCICMCCLFRLGLKIKEVKLHQNNSARFFYSVILSHRINTSANMSFVL